MPAVMLFRIGDFNAMIAVVACSIAPAIRYTALGIQRVDPKVIEAGRAMGRTPWQSLTKVATGRGLIAGLAVAFIAIIADRLISAGAARLREQVA